MPDEMEGGEFVQCDGKEFIVAVHMKKVPNWLCTDLKATIALNHSSFLLHLSLSLPPSLSLSLSLFLSLKNPTRTRR